MDLPYNEGAKTSKEQSRGPTVTLEDLAGTLLSIFFLCILSELSILPFQFFNIFGQTIAPTRRQ